MDALALLTELHGERARFVRFVRRSVPSDADAEDVTQRALERAAGHVESLDDPARARAWFYRILRNTLADHHRSASREPAREPDAEVDDLAAEPIALAPTPCRCSVQLLESLRPSYAEVLRRVDVEGEAPAAVAESLGISRGNLEVRLHRARKSLREAVKGFCCVESHQPCLDCQCEGPRRCGSAA